MQSGDIIAKDVLYGESSGGERYPVTIEIGMPFAWGGTSPTEWACYVRVSPFESKSVDIHGEGSFQALCLAIWWVRETLNRFVEEGGSLVWENGERWNMNSYWPPKP